MDGVPQQHIIAFPSEQLSRSSTLTILKTTDVPTRTAGNTSVVRKPRTWSSKTLVADDRASIPTTKAMVVKKKQKRPAPKPHDHTNTLRQMVDVSMLGYATSLAVP